MKAHPDIHSTFNSIKSLPVEIDYSGIENFVIAQPASVFAFKTFFSTTKIIFMTSGIATLITTAVLLFNHYNTTETVDTVQILTIKKEIKPEQPVVVVPPANRLPQQPIQNQFSASNNDAEMHQKIAAAETLNPPLLELFNVAAIDDTSKRKTNISVSTGNGYSYSNVNTNSNNNSGSNNESNESSSYAYSYSGNCDETKIGTSTFSTYACEKGNAYENIIQQALLDDNYIKSDRKYKYELTPNGFSVDGNEKGVAARDKYYQLLIENSCFILNGNYKFEFAKKGESISLSTSSCD